MTRITGTLKITLVVLLSAMVLTGHAAVPIPPELQEAAEAGRLLEMNTRAEASLREKLEVGQQRYREQREYRQELVQGFTSSAEERRQEISGTAPRPPALEEGAPFDFNSLAWGVIIFGIVFQVIRYFRAHPLGDLDFGLHQPTEIVVAKPVVAEENPESNWKNIVSAIHLSPMSAEATRAHQQLGDFATLKVFLDISVKLCVDISPSLRADISEDRLKMHLEKLLEPCGIGCDDSANVWLTLIVQGGPMGQSKALRHAEKIVILEKRSLTKKNLLGGTVAPEILWGAESTGYAEPPELEADVLGVLEVFAEMFVKELVVSQTAEAKTSPQTDTILEATA